MVSGGEGSDRNDLVSSPSPTEETTSTKRQRQLATSMGTLTSQSHSLISSSFSDPPNDSLHALSQETLPFHLVLEILCRLPVKFLLQFRCVCKSWNLLITNDLNFAKKHLQMSTKRNYHHLMASSWISSHETPLLWDSPVSSIFGAMSTTSITQRKLRYPGVLNTGYSDVCSCHGILCFQFGQNYALLWNPSIGKFRILPQLESPPQTFSIMYGFGYDLLNNNYKVIAVCCYYEDDSSVGVFCKTQVKVHTLGTNSWRSIQEYASGVTVGKSGKFVSGTINWLVCTDASEFISSSRLIVSLDLGTESFQEILQPDYGGAKIVTLTLGVLRDCLCIFSHSESFIDVWLMKEYGNKESWTKLISVPYNEYLGIYACTMAVYIYEDGKVLLVSTEFSKPKLVVYDSKNNTFKIPKIQNINGLMVPEVYVESLLSPCS